MDRPTCASCCWFVHEKVWQDVLGSGDKILKESEYSGACHVRSTGPTFPRRHWKEWCGEHPLAAEWAREWLEKQKGDER
jgi:hypothetical protein